MPYLPARYLCCLQGTGSRLEEGRLMEVDWFKAAGLTFILVALTVFWWMVARGLWWLAGELA